jgi:hypothetical protein
MNASFSSLGSKCPFYGSPQLFMTLKILSQKWRKYFCKNGENNASEFTDCLQQYDEIIVA